jgi:AcrR family transcriptional regulator
MEKQIDRNILLGTALNLYSRYGIRSVTMDDISRELGMSKKTIYQLVKDKQDLVTRVVEYESSLSDQMMDRFQKSGINAIDQLIEVNSLIHASRTKHNPTFYYDLKKHHPKIFAVWISNKRNRMYALLIRNMLKGKEEMLYRDDLNHHIIARLYMARMEMFNSTEVLEDDELKSQDFFREILIYHIHGICNSRGLEYFSLNKEQL